MTLEIILIIGVIAAGYFLLKGNVERGKRFVRAHEFLMQLDAGASVEVANQAAQFLMSKHSDIDSNQRAMRRADAFAKAHYNGKQLPVIALAISKGFEGAKLNTIEEAAAKSSDMKQIGRMTGTMAIQQLSMPFMLGDRFCRGSFCPPDGFFDDLFVSGFIMSFINTTRIHQLNDHALSDNERQQFMQAALEAADHRLAHADLSETWVGSLKRHQKNENVTKGANAASAIILASMGKIDEDCKDPLIEEAKALSKSRVTLYGEISDLIPNQDANDDPEATAFISSIHDLTIGRHMQERYPQYCSS